MFRSERIVIAADWKQALATHGLDNLTAVYQRHDGQRVAGSRSSEVRRLTLETAGPRARAIFIKKYWLTHPNQVIAGLTRGVLFGRCKARREYENLVRLRDWGLDAPAPVAWGEQRCCGVLVRCFLASEAIPDPLPLDRLVREQLPALPAAARNQQRRELIESLADAVRRLHSHRFVHCDLYWRNIILTGDRPRRFALIDAHKGHCWRGGAGRASRAHDLASLDAAAPRFFRRTERLRFLLRYLGAARLSAEDKRFARLILQRAAPMRERQLQRVGAVAAPPRPRCADA
jgi:hypothetical protein